MKNRSSLLLPLLLVVLLLSLATEVESQQPAPAPLATRSFVIENSNDMTRNELIEFPPYDDNNISHILAGGKIHLTIRFSTVRRIVLFPEAANGYVLNNGQTVTTPSDFTHPILGSLENKEYQFKLSIENSTVSQITMGGIAPGSTSLFYGPTDGQGENRNINAGLVFNTHFSLFGSEIGQIWFVQSKARFENFFFDVDSCTFDTSAKIKNSNENLFPAWHRGPGAQTSPIYFGCEPNMNWFPPPEANIDDEWETSVVAARDQRQKPTVSHWSRFLIRRSRFIVTYTSEFNEELEEVRYLKNETPSAILLDFRYGLHFDSVYIQDNYVWTLGSRFAVSVVVNSAGSMSYKQFRLDFTAENFVIQRNVFSTGIVSSDANVTLGLNVITAAVTVWLHYVLNIRGHEGIRVAQNDITVYPQGYSSPAENAGRTSCISLSAPLYEWSGFRVVNTTKLEIVENTLHIETQDDSRMLRRPSDGLVVAPSRYFYIMFGKYMPSLARYNRQSWEEIAVINISYNQQQQDNNNNNGAGSSFSSSSSSQQGQVDEKFFRPFKHLQCPDFVTKRMKVTTPGRESSGQACAIAFIFFNLDPCSFRIGKIIFNNNIAVLRSSKNMQQQEDEKNNDAAFNRDQRRRVTRAMIDQRFFRMSNLDLFDVSNNRFAIFGFESVARLIRLLMDPNAKRYDHTCIWELNGCAATGWPVEKYKGIDYICGQIIAAHLLRSRNALGLVNSNLVRVRNNSGFAQAHLWSSAVDFEQRPSGYFCGSAREFLLTGNHFGIQQDFTSAKERIFQLRGAPGTKGENWAVLNTACMGFVLQGNFFDSGIFNVSHNTGSSKCGRATFSGAFMLGSMDRVRGIDRVLVTHNEWNHTGQALLLLEQVLAFSISFAAARTKFIHDIHEITYSHNKVRVNSAPGGIGCGAALGCTALAVVFGTNATRVGDWGINFIHNDIFIETDLRRAQGIVLSLVPTPNFDDDDPKSVIRSLKDAGFTPDGDLVMPPSQLQFDPGGGGGVWWRGSARINISFNKIRVVVGKQFGLLISIIVGGTSGNPHILSPFEDQEQEQQQQGGGGGEPGRRRLNLFNLTISHNDGYLSCGSWSSFSSAIGIIPSFTNAPLEFPPFLIPPTTFEPKKAGAVALLPNPFRLNFVFYQPQSSLNLNLLHIHHNTFTLRGAASSGITFLGQHSIIDLSITDCVFDIQNSVEDLDSPGVTKVPVEEDGLSEFAKLALKWHPPTYFQDNDKDLGAGRLAGALFSTSISAKVVPPSVKNSHLFVFGKALVENVSVSAKNSVAEASAVHFTKGSFFSDFEIVDSKFDVSPFTMTNNNNNNNENKIQKKKVNEFKQNPSSVFHLDGFVKNLTIFNSSLNVDNSVPTIPPTTTSTGGSSNNKQEAAVITGLLHPPHEDLCAYLFPTSLQQYVDNFSSSSSPSPSPSSFLLNADPLRRQILLCDGSSSMFLLNNSINFTTVVKSSIRKDLLFDGTNFQSSQAGLLGMFRTRREGVNLTIFGTDLNLTLMDVKRSEYKFVFPLLTLETSTTSPPIPTVCSARWQQRYNELLWVEQKMVATPEYVNNLGAVPPPPPPTTTATTQFGDTTAPTPVPPTPAPPLPTVIAPDLIPAPIVSTLTTSSTASLPQLSVSDTNLLASYQDFLPPFFNQTLLVATFASSSASSSASSFLPGLNSFEAVLVLRCIKINLQQQSSRSFFVPPTTIPLNQEASVIKPFCGEGSPTQSQTESPSIVPDCAKFSLQSVSALTSQQRGGEENGYFQSKNVRGKFINISVGLFLVHELPTTVPAKNPYWNYDDSARIPPTAAPLGETQRESATSFALNGPLSTDTWNKTNNDNNNNNFFLSAIATSLSPSLAKVASAHPSGFRQLVLGVQFSESLQSSQDYKIEFALSPDVFACSFASVPYDFDSDSSSSSSSNSSADSSSSTSNNNNYNDPKYYFPNFTDKSTWPKFVLKISKSSSGSSLASNIGDAAVTVKAVGDASALIQMISGSPWAMARANAMRTLQKMQEDDCAYSMVDELAKTDHPLEFGFGPVVGYYQRGSIVGNLLITSIVVGFLLFVACVKYSRRASLRRSKLKKLKKQIIRDSLKKKNPSSSSSSSQAAAVVIEQTMPSDKEIEKMIPQDKFCVRLFFYEVMSTGLPLFSMIPMMSLANGTVASGTALIFYGIRSADIFLGLIGISSFAILLLLLWYEMAVRLRKEEKKHVIYIDYEEEQKYAHRKKAAASIGGGGGGDGGDGDQYSSKMKRKRTLMSSYFPNCPECQKESNENIKEAEEKRKVHEEFRYGVGLNKSSSGRNIKDERKKFQIPHRDLQPRLKLERFAVYRALVWAFDAFGEWRLDWSLNQEHLQKWKKEEDEKRAEKMKRVTKLSPLQQQSSSSLGNNNNPNNVKTLMSSATAAASSSSFQQQQQQRQNQNEKKKEEEKKQQHQNPKQQFYQLLYEPLEPKQKQVEQRYLDQWANIFNDYNSRGRYQMPLECTIILLTAITVGLASPENCDGVTFFVTFINTLPFVAIVSTHPFRRRALAIFCTLTAGILVAASLISSLSRITSTPIFNIIGSWFETVLAGFNTMKLGADLAELTLLLDAEQLLLPLLFFRHFVFHNIPRALKSSSDEGENDEEGQSERNKNKKNKTKSDDVVNNNNFRKALLSADDDFDSVELEAVNRASKNSFQLHSPKSRKSASTSWTIGADEEVAPRNSSASKVNPMTMMMTKTQY